MPHADRCFICEGSLVPAFAKQFDWEELGRVFYGRCAICGFVASSTHADLTEAAWQRINTAFHERRDVAAGRAGLDRWRARADGYASAIQEAAAAGAIPDGGPWLDYGCGSGDLTSLIEERSKRAILRYEPFMPGSGGTWVDAHALPSGSCDLVINTAMFEHVRDRQPLDHLASLVSRRGALALHTVVVESVPDDPTWFYLLPVHCAFFTNEAMRRLCTQWGFQSSAYHRDARLWLLFRRPLVEIPDALQREPWICREGFVAYWTQ